MLIDFSESIHTVIQLIHILCQQRVINKTHNSLSHIENLWFCYNAENPFKF